MPTIPTNVSKRALFKQEFRTVLETRPLIAPVATKLVATAKNIVSPFTGVGAAKAHTQACRVPLSTPTIGTDELVLDRYIGNAIKDCKEVLDYSVFDLTESYRGDLYASVMRKFNTQSVVDLVADATVVVGTVDLSTSEKVAEFLITVASQATDTLGVASKVDGARVVRAPRHGQPFVLAGAAAYVKIRSRIASVTAQSSLREIDGRVTETPYGVVLINLGAAADNANRLIYGVAGAPTMAFRDDMIETDMGEMVGTVTSTVADLDIAIGDAMLEKTWYAYAQTLGKTGVFSNVASLVKTQLAA